MCLAMATGGQIQEGFQEKNLKNQLAATVRSIQWSYAIFWASSAKQQGYGEKSHYSPFLQVLYCIISRISSLFQNYSGSEQ